MREVNNKIERQERSGNGNKGGQGGVRERKNRKHKDKNVVKQQMGRKHRLEYGDKQKAI